MERKWTDKELRIAFEDGCKYLSFKDLKEHLVELRGDDNILHGICSSYGLDECVVTCGECGEVMTLVRPGKYQCDNINCTFNRV